MARPVVQKCRGCGRAYYPHKIRCSCGSTDFEYEPLEERGRIVTMTVIYVPPLGFEPPLRVGIAEFAKAGIKVLGRLDGDDIDVGSEVVAIEQNGSVVLAKPEENGS